MHWLLVLSLSLNITLIVVCVIFYVRLGIYRRLANNVVHDARLLYDMELYHAEMGDLKDIIDKAQAYDRMMWEKKDANNTLDS